MIEVATQADSRFCRNVPLPFNRDMITDGRAHMIHVLVISTLKVKLGMFNK